MNHAHFNRGRSTFVCAICQRRTREAGQPRDSELCFECWELAGWDNSVNDNGPETLAEVMPERDALLAKAVKHGGNADRIRAEFNYLFPQEPS